MKKKLTLGAILLLLGGLGIASILSMEIPLPPEVEELLREKLTPQQIKLALLINPTLLLLAAIVVGVMLHEKVNLQLPLIGKLVDLPTTVTPGEVLRYGLGGGLVAGVLLGLVGLIFMPLLPAEFVALGETLQPTLLARFLYGGITEEILMRFGLMTLMVFLFAQIFKGPTPMVYWIGILIAAILFALGHFPIAFQAVENPSWTLLSYLLVGNTIGGVIFGWLYWQKGLESAMLAHLFTHVVMVLGENVWA